MTPLLYSYTIISMDFKAVLSVLLKKFSESNIDYALIGGFALGVWGVGRTTVDIDILTKRDDMMRVGEIMRELGYECNYRSENVSQYLSPLKTFGEVDFLHAFREASLEMFKRAEEKEIFGGSPKIKVVRPEDLIGLKLQSMRNNPEWEKQDMRDIESLLSIHSEYLDWSLVQSYFKLFEMEGCYTQLLKWKKK